MLSKLLFFLIFYLVLNQITHLTINSEQNQPESIKKSLPNPSNHSYQMNNNASLTNSSVNSSKSTSRVVSPQHIAIDQFYDNLQLIIDSTSQDDTIAAIFGIGELPKPIKQNRPAKPSLNLTLRLERPNFLPLISLGEDRVLQSNQDHP